MKMKNQELWNCDLRNITHEHSAEYAAVIASDAEKWADAMEKAMEHGPLSADVMFDCMVSADTMTVTTDGIDYLVQLLCHAWEYGAEIEKLYPAFRKTLGPSIVFW